MTEAMPFLQKAILLSYDLRPFLRGFFIVPRGTMRGGRRKMFHVEHWAAQKPGAPAAVCGQGLRDVKGMMKARANGRADWCGNAV